VRTDRFAVACLSSAFCYGAGCLGASPSQVKRRRAISHTTTTIKCAGRSATFDLALTKGNAYVNDPGYRLTCDPIFYLASALWDNWLPRAWILRTWIPAFRKAYSDSFSWNSVTEPMTAAAASSRRIGWVSPSPGTAISKSGDKISFMQMCPQSIRILANRDTEDWLLESSVAKDQTLRKLGPGCLPWMFPLQALVRRKPDANWTPLHQSFVRVIASGGIWTNERLAKAGLIDSDKCTFCGELASMHHRHFNCPARDVFRKHCDLDSVFAAASATADSAAPLWTRGIFPDPTRNFMPPSIDPPTWTIAHPVHGKKFTGSAFGDGSGVTPFGARSTKVRIWCGSNVVR